MLPYAQANGESLLLSISLCFGDHHSRPCRLFSFITLHSHSPLSLSRDDFLPLARVMCITWLFFHHGHRRCFVVKFIFYSRLFSTPI